MLSPRAKAFSIENLLGMNDSMNKSTTTVRNVCPQSAGGMQCIHPSRVTVHDTTGKKKIVVDLCHSDLWHSFHNLGTEMIITKTGRRMFPAVRVRIQGLDPDVQFNVFLDFVQQDNKKYRYVYHNSKWMVSGSGEKMVPDQLHRHPDCPMEGKFLASQIVSFERIKLTNSEKARHGQVSLVSMQKFVPRINIESLPTESNPDVQRFIVVFPQTGFIAVTAYQNQEITRLKIARNPFAKGFREAGKNRSSLEVMIESYGVHMDVTGTYGTADRAMSKMKNMSSLQSDVEHSNRIRKGDHQTYSYIPRIPLDISPTFLKSSNFNIHSSSEQFPCIVKMEIPETFPTDISHLT